MTDREGCGKGWPAEKRLLQFLGLAGCMMIGGQLVMVTFSATPILQVSRLLLDAIGIGLLAVLFYQMMKRWQNEVRAVEQRYSALLEYHPDPILVYDREGGIIRVNAAAEWASGYREEELIHGAKNRCLIVPKERDVTQYFTKALQGELQHYEVIWEHKNGRKHNYSVALLPIRIDGKVVGMHAISREITVQNRLWEALRESEERFRQLVEESPVGIIIRQKDKWVYLNDTAMKVLGGRKKEDILSQPILRFVHPDDQRRAWDLVGKSGKAERIERRLVTLDGEVREIEGKSIPIIYEGEQAEYIVFIDMTEINKSKEFLQQAEKLSSIGELAAGIAHEIRNPLTSLKGFVQLLQGMPLSRDEINQYCGIMLTEIERINLIVSELLLLARPKELDLKHKELRSILENVVILLNTQAILHNVQITADFEQEPLWIHCEENKIKQVFINLIKNAIEAMPQGGEIRLEARRRGDDVVVKVADQGCGIPEDKLGKLGNPFYTTKETGTGLGLMVSYSIIENHRGCISVESKVGRGTTFTVRLPYARHGAVHERELLAAKG